MTDLTGLFDALYSRLLLRDVFGKIVPGSVFLLAVASTVAPAKEVLDYVANMPFGIWTAFLGAAWITAFAIQSLGECTGAIKYHSKDSDQRFYKLKNKLDLSTKNVQKQQFERLVVIKEACGNGYVSLLLSSFVLILDHLVTHSFSTTARSLLSVWDFALSILVIIIFLARMHFVHIQRQDLYLKVVLDDD